MSTTYGVSTCDLNQPSILKAEDRIDRWIEKFKIHAESNGWEETRQSSIMPSYFGEEILDMYLESEVKKLPPSPEKLKRLVSMLDEFSRSKENPEAAFSYFESWRLVPGVDVAKEAKRLLGFLSSARPNLSEKDKEFFTTQKILNGLPSHVRSQIKLFGDIPLKETCKKVAILLADEVVAITQKGDSHANAATTETGSLTQLEKKLKALTLKVDDLLQAKDVPRRQAKVGT
ncbi:hypothetical protein RF11_16138 [Thelohanellus kitauei]|uniref:Uncharacterized protein n=1 Tax=Thelohanellus kitauei TaxID=669202 RepID=A0A0C2MTI9_THEKT|nr:hypothetical protein RF11_16138 [Thelohanellus kitauei]